jgi:hypothetical protein
LVGTGQKERKIFNFSTNMHILRYFVNLELHVALPLHKITPTKNYLIIRKINPLSYTNMIQFEK